MEKEIEKRLCESNVKNILIVDDKSENLEGARRYFTSLKSVGAEYLSSGQEAIGQIKYRAKRKKDSIDLVLTDLAMETPQIGQEVLQIGYEYLTPTFIISGGLAHGNNVVYIYPYLNKYSVEKRISGDKTSPVTWEDIITNLVDAKNSRWYLTRMMNNARKSGKLQLPSEIGRKYAPKKWRPYIK